MFHKIVKYFAILVAILIIVGIISFFVSGVSFVTSSFSEKKDEHSQLRSIKTNKRTSDLEIEVQAVKVTIRKGSSFKVDTDNDYVYGTYSGNKLYIKEKSHNYFKTRNERELIIYVPEDYSFDSFRLKNGAGSVRIEKLSCKELNFDFGAGKVDIDSLYVTSNASIDGGVGSLYIREGNIHELDLDVGVGKIDITASLIGDNKIDGGVGSLHLNLVGDINDYEVNVEKGIGKFNVNGDKVLGENSYGTGDNSVVIHGGVGTVEVNYVS